MTNGIALFRKEIKSLNTDFEKNEGKVGE